MIVDVAAMMDMAKEVKVNVAKLIDDTAETKKKTSPSDYVVLAIDDSNTDRAIMKKCLKTLGVTVLEAANGQDGLDIVKNGDKQLDAVLVDIEMPKMDGFHFAKKVKEDPRFAKFPIIFSSSISDKFSKEKGEKTGGESYLVKFDGNKLHDEISKIVSKYDKELEKF
ncbi:response regulator, partial [Helicobacter ganmani]|uniref:response regulator n=1 Tax=Helicobacter ganmani TaxID=60246 RepID=UPI003A8742C4